MTRSRKYPTPEIGRVMSGAGNALAAAMNRFDECAFADAAGKRKQAKGAINQEFKAALCALRTCVEDALDTCDEAGIGDSA